MSEAARDRASKIEGLARSIAHVFGQHVSETARRAGDFLLGSTEQRRANVTPLRKKVDAA